MLLFPLLLTTPLETSNHIFNLFFFYYFLEPRIREKILGPILVPFERLCFFETFEDIFPLGPPSTSLFPSNAV